MKKPIETFQGRPDDLAQKRHSSFIDSDRQLQVKVAKDDAKVDKSDLLGEPKRGLEFFERIFFLMANKGQVSQVKLWVWVFFEKLMFIFGMISWPSLKIHDQTVLEDLCLRQIHNPFKHQPGIQTLTVGFDYRTFWIQNLLAIRWPRVIQDPSKKLRRYVNTWPYIWKINILWWKSGRNLPHAHLHLPLGTFLFKSEVLCLQSGPSSRWSEKPLQLFPLRLLYLFLKY